MMKNGLKDIKHVSKQIEMINVSKNYICRFTCSFSHSMSFESYNLVYITFDQMKVSY